MDEYRMQSKQVILIADDSEMNRAILAEMLGDDYDVIEAENGLEALRVIEARGESLDLLLLDINMPELDGFEVLEAMNRGRWIGELPVVMISSENSSSFVERAYDLGASDYISRPFDARVVRRRVVNTLMLYAKQKKLAQMVAEQVYQKERGNNLMISILSHIVEFRNGESGRHVVHIRVITELLLRHLLERSDRYPLDKASVALISTASALHDIGKISIPSEILNKPGRFTDEEFAIMKTHSAVGADMLKNMEDFQDEPLVKAAWEICRWHHERWDGRGYPDGLKGDEIPISAQIVALADVYDALTSERCYKKAFSHEKAVEMILNGECGQFNPLLMDCLRDAAPALPGELEAGASDSSGEMQAYSVVEQLLGQEDLGGGRMPWNTDLDREKGRFFATRAEDLRFDYNAVSKTVTLSEWGARQLGLPGAVLHLEKESSWQEDKGVQALSKALRETTPESPEVELEAELPVEGKPRKFRVTGRALWLRGSEPRYVGSIGLLTDMEKAFLRDLGEQVAGIQEGELTEAYRDQDFLQRLNIYRNELYLDSLTGVYNRRYYDDHQSELERVAGIAMIDVDDFKHINDTYGHYAGDLALREIARAMSACTRDTDILMRYGGDEFLMLYPSIRKESFEWKLEQLKRAVRAVRLDEFPEIFLSISVGGVYDVHPISKAVQVADKLMYKAKAQLKRDHDAAGAKCP